MVLERSTLMALYIHDFTGRERASPGAESNETTPTHKSLPRTRLRPATGILAAQDRSRNYIWISYLRTGEALHDSTCSMMRSINRTFRKGRQLLLAVAEVARNVQSHFHA